MFSVLLLTCVAGDIVGARNNVLTAKSERKSRKENVEEVFLAVSPLAISSSATKTYSGRLQYAGYIIANEVAERGGRE